MQNLIILGSTGSIGRQTLDLVRQFPDHFRITGLAAFSSIKALSNQIREFKPAGVAIQLPKDAELLKKEFPDLTVFSGTHANEKLIQSIDSHQVLVAIVGTAALAPTITAIQNQRRIALASKEVMVAAGPLITALATKHKVDILPVDSEHAAIKMCIQGRQPTVIQSLILTASGGPFFSQTNLDLSQVTIEQALSHPKWSMGKKISIDSATLMNKGLEVIEAHELFGIAYPNIHVMIHPQSIVHSMVEFIDSSIMAQLSSPDMRLPIQYALSYPNMLPAAAKKLQLSDMAHLDFQLPDMKRFPALRLAYEAGTTGGTAPAILNAANEQAVHEFLHQHLRFTEIAEYVDATLQQASIIQNPDLSEIMQADAWARDVVKKRLLICD